MNETLEELLADKELWKDFEDGPTVEEIRKNHVFTDFDKDPDFVYEYLKTLFVADVYYAMDKQGVTKAELAKKLGKKKQYVGRVLNETANFTLKSLAEIACALDMNVAARLFPRDEHMVFEKIQYAVTKQEDMTYNQEMNDTASTQHFSYGTESEKPSDSLVLQVYREAEPLHKVNDGGITTVDREGNIEQDCAA